MDEQKHFFSNNHNQLLNIAYSAKIIARAVLIVYILYGIGAFYIEQANQMYYRGLPNSYIFFADMLSKNPIYALGLLAQIISVFLRGIIYFLILKAISLGLNMIVETDINYREARKEGDAK
jgi:hypothetical protein